MYPKCVCLRKSLYGEFSEFVHEKKITYSIGMYVFVFWFFFHGLLWFFVSFLDSDGHVHDLKNIEHLWKTMPGNFQMGKMSIFPVPITILKFWKNHITFRQTGHLQAKKKFFFFKNEEISKKCPSMGIFCVNYWIIIFDIFPIQISHYITQCSTKGVVFPKKLVKSYFCLFGNLFLKLGGFWLGVKVRNMKMDFNTGGTWRRVGQYTLMMKIYDFFLFS